MHHVMDRTNHIVYNITHNHYNGHLCCFKALLTNIVANVNL